jgi:hypothetical protein
MSELEVIRDDILETEKKYQEKQAKKRKKKLEKQEQQGRLVAPLLLLGFLIIGWLIQLIFS